MSSRSEQHAFFVQQVLEQVRRMVMGELQEVSILTPPGIGTSSKILEFLDHHRCTNMRITGGDQHWMSKLNHSLEYHLRQFQVVLVESDLLSAEMRDQVEWAVHQRRGGVIRISQHPRGLIIGEIAIS